MPLRVSILSTLAVLVTAALLPAQARRVVILYDERTELPGLAALDASLAATLSADRRYEIEIYRESMDLSRFGGPAFRESLRRYLKSKYANKPIDVVITAMGPALDFILANGSQIFPGAAIVFCGIDRRDLAKRTLPPNVTGVLVKREFRPTLELALRLHPDTRNVFIVGGSAEFDARLLDQMQRELRGFRAGPALTYLTGLPMAVLLERLSKLPPHSLVLYATIFRDGAGEAFVPHEVAEQVARIANAPTYVFVDQYVGRGVVGGHVYSVKEHGAAAAQLALAVLAGESAAAFPLIETGASTTILDWRQLRRWGIDPKTLPAGADVRFRTASVWELYKTYITAALLLALLQAGIITLLMVQRTARRRAERRYALASAAGSVGVWDWNLETDKVYVDPFIRNVLGYDANTVPITGDSWFRRVHPEDVAIVRARVEDMVQGKIASFEMEQRLLHRDIGLRWFLVRTSLVRKHGRPARITGTCTDITDRKRSDQMLEDARAELARVSRLSALGEFAAYVAHELRQPLTSVLLNAEASRRWLTHPMPNLQQVRAALADICEASRRADEMIQRNRNLFRLHMVEKVYFDLNELVRETATLEKVQLQRARVTLRTVVDENLPEIFGDRTELQQVLLNLIANAIDATEQVPARSRRIDIETSMSDERNVKVSVRDNGVGLTDVDRDQLFKLSYTTKSKGSGIGLSLCRSIIETHGG
ncbi:MAG TPA: ATP-binding protein, partial [Longimicrobiales bacterium]